MDFDDQKNNQKEHATISGGKVTIEITFQTEIKISANGKRKHQYSVKR